MIAGCPNAGVGSFRPFRLSARVSRTKVPRDVRVLCWRGLEHITPIQSAQDVANLFFLFLPLWEKQLVLS